MREILFRGKHLDTEKWVYGVPLFEVNRCYMIEDLFISPKYQCTGAVNSIVDPETVGQYTGLTDKNGKKIFDGDILRRAYYPEDDVVVEWSDGSFRFRKANKPKDYGYSSVCCIQNAVSSLKIIGNIHDNPELLKEAEQE